MNRTSRKESPGAAGAQTVAEAERWRLLEYFNYYRLTLALAATGIALFAPGSSALGSASATLFQIAALTYAFAAGIGLIALRRRRIAFDTHSTLYTFADIVLLTMLMHASGGVGSGLGILLLVTVGGASLMLTRRLAILYAALAAIAIILEHAWNFLTVRGVSFAELAPEYPQVGLLGVGLFMIAFLGNTLASRLRVTEALAERRGIDLVNLTQLNELVIQHMQHGVLVCDANGTIRLLNKAARRFLGLEPTVGAPPALANVAPDLAIQLFRWLGDGRQRQSRRPLTTRAGYQVLPQFLTLGGNADAGSLVFLEDMAALKQQAQQMKMASLARLTASIAHEIRNPLGAISNAAQLLGESLSLKGEDQRLINIIQDQSRRMNTIIENVTQLSRRDRANPVRLALESWLPEFADQYAETLRIPREIFTLTVTDGIEINADPEQLHQVVTNLCQNALRHSPPFSGTPLIRLDAGFDPEQRPYLDVIDWGAGVPADIADFIFDPFFTTTPKGTGLGLYIARELCEGNGAMLEHHAGENNTGSRFRISFTQP